MTDGKYSDHLTVINRCRQLVFEEQKSQPPTPAFVVTHDDLGNFDLDRLGQTTGIDLVLYSKWAPFSPGGPSPSGGGPSLLFAPGVDGNFCKDCPHRGHWPTASSTPIGLVHRLSTST